MGFSPEEREAEAKRLLAEARAAHREADRERSRARKLAGRIARRMQHALGTARARIDADRAAIDAKVAKFTATQSDFHAVSAADRARLRGAWAEFEVRQKRLADEWDEVNRFQARQAAALDARAAELTARESTATDNRKRIEREVAALREEAAALESRIRNARQIVEELDQRRAELQAAPAAPANVEAAPAKPQIALDRAADRDLSQWAAELDDRDERLRQDRAAVQALAASVAAEKTALADRRRVLAEQFAELAAARAQWQESECATVAEMEQLARTLRAREAELDARQERLVRADARRRDDAYELWQLRLRLEAWQATIIAYELRWHTEREEMEADFARREADLIQRQSALARAEADDLDAIPFAMVVPEYPALPAELVALRGELDRMAAVLLEAALPEPPESELPWGSDEVPAAEAVEPDGDVLLFERFSRAA